MPTLHLLGTGGAVTSPERTTTMLAFTDGTSTVAVDCGGDLVQRLKAAQVDLDTLDALIITHEHPDHVGGFPLFMEKIWLEGRRRPVRVYGIAAAIGQAKRCYEAFQPRIWRDAPPIEWREVEEAEGVLVLNGSQWNITGSPVAHGVPNMGLRVTHEASQQAVVYSSDTEPTESLARLMQPGDILVHEANGKGKGHTSAAEAAEIAARTQAGALFLVHLPAQTMPDDLEAAREAYPAVQLGEELSQHDF